MLHGSFVGNLIAMLIIAIVVTTELLMESLLSLSRPEVLRWLSFRYGREELRYMKNAAYLEDADAHAVYPTSIYRQCDALTLATQDASTIEAVMSTTITTTIKIARKVLDPSNHLLFDVYKPLGRCVAVVDDKVDEHYGAEIDNYFASHNIEFTKLVFSGNEVDKGIEDVERILVAMKKYSVGRHEPLLVIGGGVIADIAGFATSLPLGYSMCFSVRPKSWLQMASGPCQEF